MDAIHFTHFIRITQKAHIEMVFCQIVVQKVLKYLPPPPFLYHHQQFSTVRQMYDLTHQDKE